MRNYCRPASELETHCEGGAKAHVARQQPRGADAVGEGAYHVCHTSEATAAQRGQSENHYEGASYAKAGGSASECSLCTMWRQRKLPCGERPRFSPTRIAGKGRTNRWVSPSSLPPKCLPIGRYRSGIMFTDSTCTGPGCGWTFPSVHRFSLLQLACLLGVLRSGYNNHISITHSDFALRHPYFGCPPQHPPLLSTHGHVSTYSFVESSAATQAMRPKWCVRISILS